ncbi:hypothetical protein HKX48_000936 [Thoreauomyces humboldtii]|nr:hypothetical protein HKX48_000936 [Thoreauomyces humboldtii]
MPGLEIPDAASQEVLGDMQLPAIDHERGEAAPLLPGEPSAKPQLTVAKMVSLNAFWFSYQFYWFLVYTGTVPRHIAQIAGPEKKGSALSLVSLSAGFINLILAVLVGALNDRFSSNYGRRAPWIVLGAFGMGCSLWILWPSDPLAIYIPGYALLTACTVLASVPFNGLVADATPPEQRGRVSAVMGGANLGGYLAGAIVGVFAEQLGDVQLYLLMCTVLAIGTSITVLHGPREPDVNFGVVTRAPIVWKPFLVAMVSPLWTHRDFGLVFASRFLFQLGIATIQQFMQYWISDCVNTSFSPQRAVSIALLPLFVISPVAALLIPSVRRKVTVYTSAALMCLTCAVLISAHTFPSALIASAIFGIGYGPFVACEGAMLLDVLPSPETAAKDMSLWHSALVLPQIVAVPVAGWVRDWGQNWGKTHGSAEQCPGYQLIFAICVIYFLAGSVATRAIRGIS